MRKVTAVSEMFDIRKYLDETSDWPASKRKISSDVLPWLNQNSQYRPITGLANIGTLRRHPTLDDDDDDDDFTPQIQIRQIRKITILPLEWGINLRARETSITPTILVRAVRPFSRKSRTSRYWEDSGWERRNGSLTGYYRVRRRRYHGSIEIRDSYFTPLKFYIYDPPQKLLDGPHGACLHLRDDSNLKYWIHFSVQPEDIDSGIIQIERDISEALE